MWSRKPAVLCYKSAVKTSGINYVIVIIIILGEGIRPFLLYRLPWLHLVFLLRNIMSTVPQELDCGHCLAGHTKTVVMKCDNFGGEGNFKLFPIDTPPDQECQDQVCLSLQPLF